MSDINVYWGAQHGACFWLFPFMLYSYQQSIIHDWHGCQRVHVRPPGATSVSIAVAVLFLQLLTQH